MSRTSLPLLFLLLPGCVPSFSSLVSHRRYEDALCHVRSASEAEALVAAVERDTELRVHLHTVREEELQKALGDQGKAISSKVTLVRAHTFANKTPMGGSSSIDFRIEKQYARSLSGYSYPSDEQAVVLFALTGEIPPRSSTAIDGNALVRELAWGIVTVGLKQLLFGSETLTHTVHPGREDFLQSGPRAMALFDGLNHPAGAQGFLLPSQPGPPVDLSVDYTATTTDEDTNTCFLQLRYSVRLADNVPSLRESTEQRFGTRAPLATELGGTRTFLVSNHLGSWSSP